MYRAKQRDAGFASLTLEEQNYVSRMATAARTLTIYRTMANPAITDLSISPSKRKILGLMTPDPLSANWSTPGFVGVMTAEGWLSTWSGLSTRVCMLEDIKKVKQPLLVVNFEEDVTILPHEAEGTYKNAAAEDKELVRVNADHFAFSTSGPRETGFHETGAHITNWLERRFPRRP
jgi:hypothetical protein